MPDDRRGEIHGYIQAAKTGDRRAKAQLRSILGAAPALDAEDWDLLHDIYCGLPAYGEPQ